jgi:hypothetical protein
MGNGPLAKVPRARAGVRGHVRLVNRIDASVDDVPGLVMTTERCSRRPCTRRTGARDAAVHSANLDDRCAHIRFRRSHTNSIRAVRTAVNEQSTVPKKKMLRPHLAAVLLSACAPLAPTCPAAAAPIVITWDGAEAGGIHLPCALDGRPVPVAWDTTIPRLAWSSLDPPLIRLRPDLQQQPRSLQIYALLHECGHITTRSTSEDAADCWAATIADNRHLLAPVDWRELHEALTRDGGDAHWRAAEACRAEVSQ